MHGAKKARESSNNAEMGDLVGSWLEFMNSLRDLPD
jgi:hypothetical protein